MATKIIDISAYGYKDKTVSIREPTGEDMISATDFMLKEKKEKGDINPIRGTIFLLSKLIVEAPFDTSVNTLKALPYKLLDHLSVEVNGMISPLEEKSETL